MYISIPCSSVIVSTEPKPAPARKLSYAEQREREKTIKRAEKKVSEAESRISEIEAEIADIEKRIADGDVTPDIYDQHASRNKALENAMSVWELASMELDEIKNRWDNG